MSFIVFHELRRRAHGSNAMSPQSNQSLAGFIVVRELRRRARGSVPAELV